MEFKEMTHSENIDEIVLAENSYRTIHKLIKSGMWKMYCDRDFQIVSVEWSDELRRMVGYRDVNDFPDVLESWSDLLHPDDYDRIMDGIGPVLRDVTGNTIFDQEYRGVMIYISSLSYAVKDIEKHSLYKIADGVVKPTPF